MATIKKFRDIYQEVTDAVIEQMEKGNVVWHCSWRSNGNPANIKTGISYRGWNVFWLKFHSAVNNYPEPYYITYNQAQQLGGSIRKGEHGTRVIYWASIGQDKASPDQLQHLEDEMPLGRIRLVPKLHTVFNIAQTDGIDHADADLSVPPERTPIDACEKIIQLMPDPPQINLNAPYPVYYPNRDLVAVPEISRFDSEEEYYCALFHELAHSTGHGSRLDRKEITCPNRFGSDPYSREELTAELTAAFLCGITGIHQQTIQNSAAYLNGWLRSLKNDKTLILKAAGQAQKAADYIINIQPTPKID